MDKRKLLLCVIGIVMIGLGILGLLDVEYMIWVSGIGVAFYGLGGLINYLERRKLGLAKGITLANSITAMSAGAAIIIGGQLGFFAARIIILILALWLIAAGILEIIGAVMFRRAMTSADLGVQAPGSIASLVLGIVMIVAGGVAILHPIFAIMTAGIVIAIALIVSGVRMIVSSVYSGVLLHTGEQRDRKEVAG